MCLALRRCAHIQNWRTQPQIHSGAHMLWRELRRHCRLERRGGATSRSGDCWGTLAPRWGVPGSRWGALGPRGDALECRWGALTPFEAALGLHWGAPESRCEPMGPRWGFNRVPNGPHGASLGCRWAAQGASGTVQGLNRCPCKGFSRLKEGASG